MKNILIVIVVIILGVMIYNGIKDRDGFESNEKNSDELAPAKDAEYDVLKRRQTKAKQNLEILFSKQNKYFGQNRTYASSIDELDSFNKGALKKTKHHKYSIIQADDSRFRIRAEGNIDSDKYPDIIEIDHAGQIFIMNNDISNEG